MIKNFICDNCDHYLVCEKLKPLMKFHDSAKKDLLITLTMETVPIMPRMQILRARSLKIQSKYFG